MRSSFAYCKIGDTYTKCQILRLKCTKFDFRWDSVPPRQWVTALLPDLLHVFKGPISKEGEGTNGRRRREGKGRDRNGGECCPVQLGSLDPTVRRTSKRSKGYGVQALFFHFKQNCIQFCIAELQKSSPEQPKNASKLLAPHWADYSAPQVPYLVGRGLAAPPQESQLWACLAHRMFILFRRHWVSKCYFNTIQIKCLK